MTVKVRLFAILRQRAGREAVDLDLREGATVADALQALGAQPALAGLLGSLPVAMAVNREYASPATALAPGDELALIPPLSGGAPTIPAVHVSVGGREPLSVERLTRAVADPRAGAVVVFQGVTREMAALDYEAYDEMAQEKIAAILTACLERHGACAAAAEHRTGTVPLGEPSVLVAVSAPHREEAFAAARQAIDEIKAQAPVWKRELQADGRAEWVAGTPPPDAAEGPSPPDASPSDAPSAATPPTARGLTHLDGEGAARMVDVAAKPVSSRRAVASARVRMSPGCARAVEQGDGPKGEVLATARLAGVMAAKRTAELIPLAHPVPTTFIDVRASVDADQGLVELIGEARADERTGVELEAMTACAVAALTVYDMVKALERGVAIEQVRLLEKTGGESGDWHAEESTPTFGGLWEG